MENNFMGLSKLDEIEDRAQAATAGPWEAFVEGRDHMSGDTFIRIGSLNADAWGMYVSLALDNRTVPAGACDLDFIAHARQDVPALVARLRPYLKATARGHYPGRSDRALVDAHADYGNLVGYFVRLDVAVPSDSLYRSADGGPTEGWLGLNADEADELGQLLIRFAAEVRTANND